MASITDDETLTLPRSWLEQQSAAVDITGPTNVGQAREDDDVARG